MGISDHEIRVKPVHESSAVVHALSAVLHIWLATLEGLFSTGTDTQKPSRILIRARCEKDINHLFNRYREKPPTSDDAGDYRCRLSISKKDWVSWRGLS
ncbi:MAG: hypothetical protein QOJ51_1415 [Acidobacteriaceae bacterium]|jgi:hypothetical protein|nr:hypothetical protein [Acidobacteriaceae bacterium]